MKAYRLDWYASDALISLSKLNPVEIAVMIQVCNLIYVKNGPIAYDPREVARYCNLGKKRTERVLARLIELEKIYVTETGKISQLRCEKELEAFKERIEKSSKNGIKGAVKRWEIEGKQPVVNGGANSGAMPITNTETIISNEPSPRLGLYRIDHLLSEGEREKARNAAKGWDLQYLMRTYDQWVNEKGQSVSSHGSAFLAWIRNFTKGKPSDGSLSSNWH